MPVGHEGQSRWRTADYSAQCQTGKCMGGDVLNSVPREHEADSLCLFASIEQRQPGCDHRLVQLIDPHCPDCHYVHLKPSQIWGSCGATVWPPCPPFGGSTILLERAIHPVVRTLSIRCAPWGDHRICWLPVIRRCSSHCTVLSVIAVEIGSSLRRAAA
jgi:hypothetical protein